MSNIKLNSEEIQKVLTTYQSEVKTLDYRKGQLRAAIAELKSALKEKLAEEKAAVEATEKAAAKPAATKSTAAAKKATTGRRGRPKKTATKSTAAAKKTTTGKRGRPKKTEAAAPAAKATTAKTAAPKKKTTTRKTTAKKTGVTRERALSEWDNAIIKDITDAGQVRINSELLAALDGHSKASGQNLDDAKLKAKLNQSLQKLVNKKGLVVKVKFSGKGNAYGLKEWTSRRGSVAVQYRR